MEGTACPWTAYLQYASSIVGPSGEIWPKSRRRRDRFRPELSLQIQPQVLETEHSKNFAGMFQEVVEAYQESDESETE